MEAYKALYKSFILDRKGTQLGYISQTLHPVHLKHLGERCLHNAATADFNPNAGVATQMLRRAIMSKVSTKI